LPIVRLSRDKRGLDTIYLIDTSTEGGRRSGGARVLYFWTAPPGLRVGRTALDESAQHALQRAHPDVAFDWPALRKAVDAALAQAAALSADVRRDAWRTQGKPSRAAQRAGGRDEAPPVTAASMASPSPGPSPASPRPAPRSEPLRLDEGRPTTEGVGEEAVAQAAGAAPASEDGAAAGRRPRRRRRRSKRPSGGDETPSSPDPIIES
jgi:hypothetical protein